MISHNFRMLNIIHLIKAENEGNATRKKRVHEHSQEVDVTKSKRGNNQVHSQRRKISKLIALRYSPKDPTSQLSTRNTFKINNGINQNKKRHVNTGSSQFLWNSPHFMVCKQCEEILTAPMRIAGTVELGTCGSPPFVKNQRD